MLSVARGPHEHSQGRVDEFNAPHSLIGLAPGPCWGFSALSQELMMIMITRALCCPSAEWAIARRRWDAQFRSIPFPAHPPLPIPFALRIQAYRRWAIHNQSEVVLDREQGL